MKSPDTLSQLGLMGQSHTMPLLTKQFDPKTLPKFLDPEELRMIKHQQKEAKYKQLLPRVMFLDTKKGNDPPQYVYSADTLLPYVYFFKLLARKPEGTYEQQMSTINRLKLWIPDTIVMNDGELPPMWFYSSQQGYVYRVDAISPQSVAHQLGHFSSPDELVAVVKQPQYDDGNLVGNHVSLVSSRDLQVVTNQCFGSRTELTILQKYVQSNGPQAFICRTVWRKGRNAYAWIITNKNDYFTQQKIPDMMKYVTNVRKMGSCTIVDTVRGIYIEETLPYIENLLRYLHIHLNLKFKQFVCDFIKDESGIWWLINIRGFIFDQGNSFPVDQKCITMYGEVERKVNPFFEKARENTNYKQTKACRYCDGVFSQTELTHQMTLKMIYQTDRYLIHRGLDQDLKWLERSNNLFNIDNSLLYQNHQVCITCYQLYTETVKLIQIETKFAYMIGIPVDHNSIYSLLNMDQLKREPDTKVPDINNLPSPSIQNQNVDSLSFAQIDINPQTQLIFENNQPRINDTVSKCLNRFRLMVLFHSLEDIPMEGMGARNPQKNYFIEYQLFDQRPVRYQLEFYNEIIQKDQKDHSCLILNKLRVFYFFSQGRVGISNWITENKSLQINLLCENEQIGVTQVELQDFYSDQVIKREFYQVFSGQNLPVLRWALDMTIGIVDSGQVDVTTTPLKEHGPIYIPDNHYFAAQLLPKEWIMIFHDKKDPVGHNYSNFSHNESLKLSHHKSDRQRLVKKPQSASGFKSLANNSGQYSNINSPQTVQSQTTKSRLISAFGENQSKLSHRPLSSVLSQISPSSQPQFMHASQANTDVYMQSTAVYNDNRTVDDNDYQSEDLTRQILDQFIEKDILNYSKDEHIVKRKYQQKIYY